MAISNEIINKYLKSLKKQKQDIKSQAQLERKFVDPLVELLIENGEFLTPLSYYQDILKRTNKIFIVYMPEEQKKVLKQQLQTTYLLLLAQKKYELELGTFGNQTAYIKQIESCEEYLDLLNPNIQAQSEAQRSLSKEKPVLYLGIGLGIELSHKMLEVTEGKYETFSQTINWLNDRRLYWIWGSSFILSILDSLPHDFFHKTTATKTVLSLDPYAGVISWALYYFRFSLQLGLLLRHVIAGPWMSEKEKQIPLSQRFLTQWEQRKYAILNDFLWGTCNLVCFFWLIAKKGLGPWGDLLNTILFFFDISAAIWSFEEKQTQYMKKLHEYQDEITRIKGKIALLDEKQDKQKIALYQTELDDVTKAYTQHKKDWDYYKLQLLNECAYCVSLTLAFVLLAAPFFPLAGVNLLAVTMTGAILCLVFTVIYNAVTNSLDIAKTKASVDELKENIQCKIAAFNELSKMPHEENELKFLFLEIKQLQADSKHQEQIRVLQTMHFYRQLLFDALFPAIILTSLVFLPLATGLPVIGISLVFAYFSYKMIDSTYAPVEEELTEFPEEEYLAFCDNPAPSIAYSQSSFFAEEKDVPNVDGADKPIPS